MNDSEFTRRQMMIAAGGIGLAGTLGSQVQANDDELQVVSATEGIKRLKAGNLRFANGKPKHSHSSQEWRKMLLSSQNPFAVILGCADSRVPVEMIFDQGFGDLFVIRNAGNVVLDDVIGSVEYAVLHLKTKLVVVMGHEGCGAVTAALQTRAQRMKEPPELQHVLRLIDPAIKDIDPDSKGAVNKGVEANVNYTVKKARQVCASRNHPALEGLEFVGAVYSLNTGKVRFL